MKPGAIGSSGVVVVMGVAGCGKSVVGTRLAQTFGAIFVEGDRLHPPANVEKMAGGEPLTDQDRQGWLDAIGREAARLAGEGNTVVVACSALKRDYRDRLRGFFAGAIFVYLEIDAATARHRVAARPGHFMPASLVESQFAILEPPQADEAALTLDGTLPVSLLCEQASAWVMSSP